MKGQFRPEIVPDPEIVSPSPTTEGEFLDETVYADLYRLVDEEGLPYFVRLNGQGTVELFLVFENIDAFREATTDAVSIEFKTYQNKLLAVIWTLSDPMNPLGFPLSFDIDKEEDRFMALALIGQAETPIHYLAYMDRRVLHIFSESITFSQAEKDWVEGIIRRLYEDEQLDEAPAEEVREGELATIPVSVLSDAILREKGIAYEFRYSEQQNQQEAEEAQALLMNTLQQSLLVVRRHARSEVRESKCTIWAGQDRETITLFVTPDLTTLFQDSRVAEGEANPFTRFLGDIPTYQGSRSDHPLMRGAYPILRYESGQLFHLELDESTQERLSRLFDSVEWSAQMSNPYDKG